MFIYSYNTKYMNFIYRHCRKNNTSEVIKLLEDNPNFDINTCNCFGDTLLSIACGEKNIDLVKFLMEQPTIDVNKHNSSYITPLCIACRYSDTELLKILLSDPKIDVNIMNAKCINDATYTETVFSKLCEKQICGNDEDIEIIKILLEHDKLDINKPDNEGNTPFVIACNTVNTDMIEILFENPLTEIINYYDTDGRTPLHLLCCADYDDPNINNNQDNNGDNDYESGEKIVYFIQKLLDNSKVDVNCQNNMGNTPFHLACSFSMPKTILTLLDDFRIDVTEDSMD